MEVAQQSRGRLFYIAMFISSVYNADIYFIRRDF